MKNITYINAGAGSGKTYTLTTTLVSLIKEGMASPEEVILTTFTTKAAAEFREKAKEFLFKEGLSDEAVRLDQAMIGTVHSVCQQLIKKYWFALGLSPDMDVMAEEDANLFLSQSLSNLPTAEEVEQLRMFAHQFDIRKKEGFISTGIDENFWQTHLREIIGFATNYEIEDFSRSRDESINFIRQLVDDSCHVNVTDDILDRMLLEARTHVAQNNRIRKKEDYYKKFNDVERGRREKTIAWHLQVAKVLLPKYGDTCAEASEQIAHIWRSPEVFGLQEKYITLLFDLAGRWREMYAQFKREKNLLDYNDMEKYMRRLLQDPDIAAEISRAYKYLFVDEFQDSSPIQVKIFDDLSDLMVHSYWVGDYKQSIYRFRGSDIDLVKAVVDTVASSSEGCDTRTLGKSYRSLPPIVGVCNDVFGRTFGHILAQDNIRLAPHRQPQEADSLRYFWADDAEGLASHVAKLVDEGYACNDIAVIARRNIDLEKLASALKASGIPASREGAGIVGSPLWSVVASLLRIIDSQRDTLSQATVAYLLDETYDTRRIIEERIRCIDADAPDEEFLRHVPVIGKVMALRGRLQQQSVGHLVDSMAVELNLFDELKRVGSPDFVASALQTIINAAHAYEEHCVQLNLPTTISGFIAYMEAMDPPCAGSPEGVQLHTYHSCKGLQWKAVVLTSLNDHPAEEGLLMAREIYGVHFAHSVAPSAADQYPEVFIRLTPWIFGSSRSVPAEIGSILLRTAEFAKAQADSVAEANRLLYVGMTRARDVLALNLQKPKKSVELLQWFKDVGLEEAARESAIGGAWDLLSTGATFADFTILDAAHGGEETSTSAPFIEDSAVRGVHIPESDREPGEPRYVSPSALRVKGHVLNSHNFNIRVPITGRIDDWSQVGNCIHHIFGLMDTGLRSEPARIADIIRQYGLEQSIKDTDLIIAAWDNLQAFLTEKHSSPKATSHEVPFRMERDGRTLSGSMDYVWTTPEGEVLVDFKTCPMGVEAILDADSEHYAGWYAGQLDAYADAQQADGHKVLARYIYYPVSGIVTEISPGFDLTLPFQECVIHAFGIEDIDIRALCRAAEMYCSDGDFSGNIGFAELEPNDPDDAQPAIRRYQTVLYLASTQGVAVTIFSGEQPHVHLELPHLASEGDVKMLFGFLNALLDKFPGCELIFSHHGDRGRFIMCKDNFDALLGQRILNMRYLVECTRPGQHIGVYGVNHQYMVPTREDYPDLDTAEITGRAVERFLQVQWDYAECADADLAQVKSSDGAEYMMRFLTNETDTFVGVCERLALTRSDGTSIKMVTVNDFRTHMKDNPNFEEVDHSQFVLRKMSSGEWDALYESLEGEVATKTDPIPPRVYVLRWNPDISSYKMDTYERDREEYPDGWTSDWSIYDYEQARQGDLYVMMCVGEGNTGVVFHGDFASDPYQSKDWRQTGRMIHYVDINCFNATAPDELPILTPDELYLAIPDVDWLHGHSGELLSPENGLKLLNLLRERLS